VRLWVPGEARPKFENRVDVSPTVRDAWGIPVSRITHSLHPNDYQLYEFFRGKMVELLKEAGATEVISRPQAKAAWMPISVGRAGWVTMQEHRSSIVTGQGPRR
jgi:hypothetical protein